MKNSVASTRLRWLGLSIGLLGLVQIASSATLYGTFSTNSGVTTVVPSPYTSLSALIAIGPPLSNCFVVGTCAQFALLQGLDASANGTSIAINPGDPNFSAVVSVFTNGTLDFIQAGIVPGTSFGTSSGGATLFPETKFGTSPDFVGLVLSALVVRIDNVLIQPNAVVGGTEFRLFYTVSVYGVDTVPEPATWVSVAIGCCALFVRRRAKRLRLSSGLPGAPR